MFDRIVEACYFRNGTRVSTTCEGQPTMYMGVPCQKPWPQFGLAPQSSKARSSSSLLGRIFIFSGRWRPSPTPRRLVVAFGRFWTRRRVDDGRLRNRIRQHLCALVDMRNHFSSVHLSGMGERGFPVDGGRGRGDPHRR